MLKANLSIFNHDAVVDSSRLNAKASCREKVINVVVCANSRDMNVFVVYSQFSKLQAITFDKVDMPFPIDEFRNVVHAKRCFGKTFINLLSYLEVFK